MVLFNNVVVDLFDVSAFIMEFMTVLKKKQSAVAVIIHHLDPFVFDVLKTFGLRISVKKA